MDEDLAALEVLVRGLEVDARIALDPNLERDRLRHYLLTIMAAAGEARKRLANARLKGQSVMDLMTGGDITRPIVERRRGKQRDDGER